ncbi:MAG: response regulator [Nitrospira sp.]|nr:MAG: response regulator [Nitrospira sp.]
METTILIVDDAPDSWNLLSSIVRAHHFHPIWAADGLQAVSEARKHQPHVILLDLGLPGGKRLCRTRTTEAEPAAVGHSRDCGDRSRPCGGGAKSSGVWSERVFPETRGGGRIDCGHTWSAW